MQPTKDRNRRSVCGRFFVVCGRFFVVCSRFFVVCRRFFVVCRRFLPSLLWAVAWRASAMRLPPASVAETAFLEMVTVRPQPGMGSARVAREATRLFRQHGVARVPTLTASEVAVLMEDIELQRRPRNAFGQLSQRDRYTVWIAGTSAELSNGDEHEPGGSVLRRVIGGDLAKVWRRCVASLGAPHLGLAEVVTSMPGGRAQAWHQDGAGVTLQIALCHISLAQGPTELRPRAFVSENLVARCAHAWRPWRSVAAVLHRLQRPLYKRTSAIHASIWDELAGRGITPSQAMCGMRLGLLPPPPLVRLTADAGMLVMYDAAMRHRGGMNHGEYARPVLAIHMRQRASRHTPETFLECYQKGTQRS